MRVPAGIVWTELQQRRYDRARIGHTEDDLALLLATITGLEKEFPDAVAFELELWHEAVWLNRENDRRVAGGAGSGSPLDARDPSGPAVIEGAVVNPTLEEPGKGPDPHG